MPEEKSPRQLAAGKFLALATKFKERSSRTNLIVYTAHRAADAADAALKLYGETNEWAADDSRDAVRAFDDLEVHLAKTAEEAMTLLLAVRRARIAYSTTNSSK